jgi:hypothetical protein
MESPMQPADRPHSIRDHSRRGFLQGSALAGLGAAAAGQLLGAKPPAPPDAEKTLPQIRIGKHSISRLVCGSNCFAGGSHLSMFVNKEMQSYYTPEQILKTLRRCQSVGINTWQAHGTYRISQAETSFLELHRRHVDAGGKMQFLSLESGEPGVIRKLAQGGCIGIAHHGESTDWLFQHGKLDKMHEFLKRVRDAGLLVGISTHMPDVVDAVESKGWDIDYYMTCIYQRHRSEAELLKVLGHVPLPVGEVYLKSDPPRMFKAIQQTKRTCLAFKILAAGRLSDQKQWVERAFQETLAAIKPGDGLIVGIYDRYSDQPAEDAALVRRLG